MKKFFTLFLSTLFMYSCKSTSHYFSYHHSEFPSPSKNRNVCGMLQDSVIVYPIFVDVSQFHPWTNFDIESTTDSIKLAMEWLEYEALKVNRKLNIKVIPHVQKNKLSIAEYKVRPKNIGLNFSLLNSTKKKHLNHTDKWANKIAKECSKAIKLSNENKLATKNKVVNVERLIARLRDKYKTDNLALMFFVNGYYENHFSVSMHTYSDGPQTEYSIVTNKNPAIISHEFLHLFGAIDLYPHHAHPNFNYKDLAELYPYEIMLSQHINIRKLKLSPITKYYIGWQENLDKANTRLLYHHYNVLEY